MKNLLMVALLAMFTIAFSQTFTEIGAGLAGVTDGTSEWGDFDCDGDPDLVITGLGGSPNATIYRNDAGIFNDNNAGLESVFYSSSEWGDYDCDGDLDLFISGFRSSSESTKIYRNDEGIFTDINAGLPAVINGSSAWGDFDNDGDLDLIMTGIYGGINITKIYRNDEGTFTDINAGLTGVADGSSAWGDYDNDGDPDLIITGNADGFVFIAKIYNNDGGIFSDISAGLTGVHYSSSAWGDYDSDGDLDLIVTGDTGSGYISRIYQNNAGIFSDIGAGLTGLTNGSSAWGDYDNDGDLDLIITGSNGSGSVTKVYCNNNVLPNTIPSAPDNSSLVISDSQTVFSWSKAADTETPQNGLTYNLDLVIDGINITSPMADITNGYRKIVAIGNKGHYLSHNFKSLKTLLPQEEPRSILCKIQTIDNCFAGSEFSTIADSTLISRDLKLITYDEMEAGNALAWEYVYSDSILNYQLQLDDDVNFSTPIEQIVSLSKEGSSVKDLITYYTIALNELTDFGSLVNNTRYYWRVKPNYIFRTGRYNETVPSFIYNKTNIAPNAPVSGFNPANDDLTTGTPLISWGNASDPDGNAQDLVYTIEVDSTNTFGTVIFTDTTDAGETYSQVTPALADGYRYYYRVKTIDAGLLESSWSATQQFITLMPPQAVKITNDGSNVTVDWEEVPVNTKGVIYTVYGSDEPYSGYVPVAVQLTTSEWTAPIAESKKFYRVTAGSSSK